MINETKLDFILSMIYEVFPCPPYRGARDRCASFLLIRQGKSQIVAALSPFYVLLSKLELKNNVNTLKQIKIKL